MHSTAYYPFLKTIVRQVMLTGCYVEVNNMKYELSNLEC